MTSPVVDAVDRLPLALEMLAGPSALMDVHQLADLVRRRPDLVTSSDRHAPERHRTLAVLVADSLDRLEPADRESLVAVRTLADRSLLFPMDRPAAREPGRLQLLRTVRQAVRQAVRLSTPAPSLHQVAQRHRPGRFTEHHAFLARIHLDLIDHHSAAVDERTAQIEALMEPFRGFHTLICTIPGIATRTADVIVAETGADMTRFPTAKHLASWAGTTAGEQRVGRQGQVEHDPAGQPLPTRRPRCCCDGMHTEPGHLLGARYRRIATRRGPQKANVAI